MSKYDDLVRKLKEIFQIDRPELDFGVYRILNARAGEINDYLDNRLKARVQEALAHSGNANQEQLRKELAEAEKNAESLGMKADDVPKVQVLRQRLAELAGGAADHENAVYSHLLTFFSRYYDSGDFISQRRYKGDTYAIPYAGEEVVLHWANKDQYYTKSGENFANYSFKLDDGRTVHFRLVAADTAKDNRKDNDKERRFVLIEQQTRVVTDDDGDEYEEELLPVEEANGVLLLRFEYKPMPKGSKQDDLMTKAVQNVLSHDAVKSRWLDLARREPTDKNPQRTLLEKHLTTYTQKNTADYFIHKDLGRFLRGELDFYIKNEVMNLDDVQNTERFADIEKNLRMIQCLRAIALDLITFLAQLEDFQKKLWLKKKFVVAAHYCITLDRIIKDAPELLAVIVANEKQWEQWDKLGMLEGKNVDLFKQAKSGTVGYLREHPFLMVDTALFGSEFKDKLLAEIDNLDESLDGLLIHGDNVQALNLLQEQYREQVKCVYTDPPYNTKTRDFLYKDSYKHSSWASMMFDRISACHGFLTNEGLICHYIDENEHTIASLVLNEVFGTDNRCGDVVWKNSSKNDQDYVSMQHEYLLLAVKGKAFNKGEWNERKEGLEEIYAAFNGFRKKHETDWKAIHSEALKWYRQFPESNPITDSKHYSWMDERGVYFPADISGPNYGQYRYDVLHPVTGKTCKEPASGWRFPEETMKKRIVDGLVHFGDDEATIPNNKTYLKDTETQSLTSIKYRDGRVASKLLAAMFGGKTFSNPKDVDISMRLLRAFQTQNEWVLDFFAGTGTAGHAVLALNREDKTRRKYILVEQGEYFDTVLKPRIQKVVYSADWKDGKATAPDSGISHAFKVLKIESYEDTLNNLELRRTDTQQSLLNSLPDSAKCDYLLRYMLDIESQGSILSVDSFRKPFDCKLKVAVDSAGAFEERTIDLVETFNYLIGLRVKSIDSLRERGIVMVQGTLPTGEKTLVLWRDCEQVDYEALNRFCDRHAINPKDSEFEVVYINGDHNIPAVLTTTEDEGGITKTLKLRQIEPEFLSRMFGGEV
ncbi:site-specific DNA-methyltransferase [Geotalea uraniireducens]|nr:site-specific DNA-methyltransferase [Geotalea uraniireducens]